MGPGLYVHVPFCVRKCAYCAFFSRPVEWGPVQAWLEGIEKEFQTLPDSFAPDTVFIGGGTPTVLDAGDLERLLESLRSKAPSGSDCYNVRADPFWEWTCEVNPGTLTADKARLLRAAGVNRISIGVQSFHDDVLRRLGRCHSAQDARQCVEVARAAGFDNLNLDLIYGVPGVERATFQADVEAALELQPDHLSGYCLEIEAGTPFAKASAQGRLTADPQEQRSQFDWLRRRLSQAGFIHYEVSNFARPGRECRHNRLYWSGGSYIGMGPAAHSHWEGLRWGNTATLPEWKREFEELLCPEAKARETLVMGLRRLDGWSRAEFQAATGFDYDQLSGDALAQLESKGWLVRDPDRIRLDEGALFISDSVFVELV